MAKRPESAAPHPNPNRDEGPAAPPAATSTLLELDAARALVLRDAPLLPAETVALSAARGRRLAAPLVAQESQPPADLSAMDGYAVRAADLAGATAEAPVALTIVGLSRAGGPDAPSPGPGEAVRIATGARVPAGADTVVMQEGCVPSGDGRVVVRTAAGRGANIRLTGEEYRPGDVLLPAGSLCTPAAIGLLASGGWSTVAVHRRPRVAILSLGDELLDPARRRRDVNQPMLRAACESLGAEVVEVGVCADSAADAAAWLSAAASRSDLLLTSGSASVGDYDVVGDAWRLLGVAERFSGVAIRPGKPCHFGVLPDGPLVFALPGNPLAALTGFEELVAPALEQMAGGDWRPAPRLRLPLAAPLDLKRDARYLLRLGAGEAIEPPDRQGSAPLRQAAQAQSTADWQGPCHLPDGWPVEVRPTAEAWRGRVLRPAAALPAVIAVRGYSDSGKTRLIEQLVPALMARGLRVGTVKHAHHELQLEPAGKDSARHAAAGASMVLALGPDSAVMTRYGRDEQPPAAWLELFAGQVELVLVEGFKQTPLPHVALRDGSEFGLTAGHLDGLRCWHVTRPAGERLTFPDELLEAWPSNWPWWFEPPHDSRSHRPRRRTVNAVRTG